MWVHHVACGEAPGGLQPDHGPGRGRRGAFVHLPHHHSPFVVAQVGETHTGRTHEKRTNKPHTHRGPSSVTRHILLNINLNQLLFLLLITGFTSGERMMWRAKRRWNWGSRPTTEETERGERWGARLRKHCHLPFFLSLSQNKIQFYSLPPLLFFFHVRQKCGNSTSK